MSKRNIDIAKLISLLLVSLLLLSGCGLSGESFTAKTPSLKETETLFPSPTIIPTPVPTKISTPLPVQIMELDLENATYRAIDEITLRTICVNVEQSYPDFMGKEFKQPIKETVSHILESIGIKTNELGELCDANLKIELEIEPVKEEYSGGLQCYQGVETAGKMILEIPTHIPQFSLMHGYVSPPFIIDIDDCIKNPVDAPFHRSWTGALLEGFNNIWSIQVVKNALQDQDEHIRHAAADFLCDYGKIQDREDCYPELIKVAYHDESEDIRKEALFALSFMDYSAIEISVLVDIMDNECSTFGITPEGIYTGDVIAARKPQDDLAIRALTQCLEKSPGLASISIINALEEIGPEAINAVPALVSLFEEQKDYQSEKVLEALQTITGQDFGLDASQWIEWWDGFMEK